MPTRFLLLFVLIIPIACSGPSQNSVTTYPDVQVAGAMRNVMWKGALGPSIQLDTIEPKTGLYALGPLSYLRGELLINNGDAFVSQVNSDSSMRVTATYDTDAPFLVYGWVQSWETVELPETVEDLPALESFLDEQTKDQKRPFIFKLRGTVTEADIHIQNLAEGSKVSSPAEAHQGQVNYPLMEEEVELIGFFSTEHQGVFTHHDTYMHLHLISQDQQKMGHLDRALWSPAKMDLMLPVQ